MLQGQAYHNRNFFQRSNPRQTHARTSHKRRERARKKSLGAEQRTRRASKPETQHRYAEKSAEIKRLEIIRKNVYDTLPRNKIKTHDHDR